MRIRKNRRGFTLLELILAVSISSLVLIGVFSIAASMVQYEVEASRNGSVTAWTMASITSMNRDIAGASVIQWPDADGATDDTAVVCTNWSRLADAGGNGAQLSTIVNPPTVISYCWDVTTHLLRRLEVAGNCPGVGAVPAACTAANYSGGVGGGNIVATAVYQVPGNPGKIFTTERHTPASPDGYSLRLRYVVGNPSQGTVAVPGGANTNFVNPQFLSFDTKVLLEN